MKSILLFYSLAVMFFSCSNNGGDNKDVTGNNSSSSSSTTNSAKSADGNPCSRMIFFQPGAEIEATSYNKEGKEISKQYTKILSVKNEGGFTVANVEGKDIGPEGDEKATIVNYNYKCDGNKIYFDIASMFRTAEKNKEASFESSLIEYPINIKEGEVLPDATGNMSSEKDGKKMTMKYFYKNRKVEGKESITTAAGTWSCFKITNSVEVELDIPGMDETSKEMMKTMQNKMKTTTTTWFAPDLGIVKMEMYLNGQLTSRNEVTGIKR